MDLANNRTKQSATPSASCLPELQPNFWPCAFYHYIRLYYFVPHGNRPLSPYKMCCAPHANLARLRTFGCRIHVPPTTARSGRVVPNSCLCIFLGYSRSLKFMFCFNLGSLTVKTATHARFDAGMNGLDEPPPNAKLLLNLADIGVVNPDCLDPPSSTWKSPMTPSSASTNCLPHQLQTPLPLARD